MILHVRILLAVSIEMLIFVGAMSCQAQEEKFPTWPVPLTGREEQMRQRMWQQFVAQGLLKEPGLMFEVKLPQAAEHLQTVLARSYSFNFAARPVREVIDEVMVRTHLPILVHKEARDNLGQRITIALPQLPLASGLQILLAEAGLTYRVDGQVAIVCDQPASLVAGKSTAWVTFDDEVMQRIDQTMSTRVAVVVQNQPLAEFVASLSKLVKQPIVVDQNSLELMTLTLDVPISVSAQNTPLRHVLTAALRDLDLECTVTNEQIYLVSNDTAEELPLVRIYWLDNPASKSVPYQRVYDLIMRLHL